MRRDSVSPRPVPSSFELPGGPAGRTRRSFLVLGRHPDAGVGHRDHELGSLAVGADGNAAAVGRELDGVGDQVEDHLLESQLVGLDHPDVVSDFHRDGDGVQSRPLADHCHGVVHGTADAEHAGLEHHLTRFNLRQVQDLVEQLEEVPARVPDVSQVLVLALVDLAEHAIQQHLGEITAFSRVRSSWDMLAKTPTCGGWRSRALWSWSAAPGTGVR